MSEPIQVNQQYVAESLTNQLATTAMERAKNEAAIRSMQERIQELEKELEEVRKEQVKEMDSAE